MGFTIYGLIEEISNKNYLLIDYDTQKLLDYKRIKTKLTTNNGEIVFEDAYLKEECFLEHKNIFKIGNTIKIEKIVKGGFFFVKCIDVEKELSDLKKSIKTFSASQPADENKVESSSDVFEEKITKIISNDIISYVSNNIFNTSILNDSPMGYILLMDTINEYEDIALEDIIKHYYYQISDFKAKMIFLKASTIAKDYYWKPKDAIPPKVKTKSIINTNGYYTASFTKYIEKLQANYEFHYTFLFNDYGLVWCIPHDNSPYHPSDDEIEDFMLYTDYDEFCQITKYEISGYSIELKYFLPEDEESIKSDNINPSFYDCWRGTINQNILVLSYYKSVLNPYTNKYVEIPTFSNIKFNFHEITN